MSPKIRALALLPLLLTLSSGCSGSDSTDKPKANPSAASSPSSEAQTAGESLPARWWQWSESVPSAQNPIDDPTGSDCGKGQPADVWFLAGTHGGAATRTCKIPLDRPVYFPVLNQICTVVAGESASAAIESCSASADVATATLDGKALQVTDATSPADFTFTAQPDSQSGMEPGPHQAVTWGLWVGPLPLTAGAHTIAFRGQAGSFTTEVTYNLTVG